MPRTGSSVQIVASLAPVSRANSLACGSALKPATGTAASWVLAFNHYHWRVNQQVGAGDAIGRLDDSFRTRTAAILLA